MSLINKLDNYYLEPNQENFKKMIEEFEAMPTTNIMRTNLLDSWHRPIYISDKNKVFVDIEMNDKNPRIYSTSYDGEPECPIFKYEIVDPFLTHKQTLDISKKCLPMTRQ